MRPRLVVALTLPFSFVAGHVVGLALDHGGHGQEATVAAGHEYLRSLGAIGIPLVLVSLVVALVAGARKTPFRPRYLPTAASFLAVFATVEMVEHLAAGWSPADVAREPSFWLGLATQVLVATVVVAALRLLVRVGSLLGGAAPALVVRAGSTAAALVLPRVRSVALTPIRRRGPPVGARC